MHLVTTTLLFFVFNWILVSARHFYSFPKPSFLVLSPKGLKVSLAWNPGDQLFTFHANVNKPIEKQETGDISGDAFKKQKGQWIVRDDNVELEAGDKIYFWMFLQNGNVGYVRTGEHEIKDVEIDSSGKTTTHPPIDTTTVSESKSLCEKVVHNLTGNLIDIQNELESVKDVNNILKNLVEQDIRLSRTLYIDGHRVDEQNLIMVVQAIIKNKMGLDIRVENIVRKNERIEFQVDSLEDKLQVLAVAKIKLKHSSYDIKPI